MRAISNKREGIDMKRRLIETNIKWLLGRKEAGIAFGVLLFLCLLNFVRNVNEFHGEDVIRMYEPMKLTLLSFNRVNFQADMTFLVMQVYPILVTIPAGFALLEEDLQNRGIYQVSRVGRKNYLMGKVVSAFFVTTFLFSLPFLLEMGLYLISFPKEALGDLSNLAYLSPEYAEQVKRYWLSEIYMKCPMVYHVLGILMFGFVSGLFGAFTVACSEVIRFRFRVLLFLPAFLLINGIGMVGNLLGNTNISVMNYLFLYCDEDLDVWFFGVVLTFVLVFVVGATGYAIRKDRFVR